jgi:hypothetical protein
MIKYTTLVCPGAGAKTSVYRLRLQPKVSAPAGSGSATLHQGIPTLSGTVLVTITFCYESFSLNLFLILHHSHQQGLVEEKEELGGREGVIFGGFQRLKSLGGEEDICSQVRGYMDESFLWGVIISLFQNRFRM